MSMLDSFFSKGSFKASRCKTQLKLTIPRIKLLRNRREMHIKQMRRDIAKLLETGQEATARIRVEHIIREEKMMAAQEIIELFCELVVVRLPIIETQSYLLRFTFKRIFENKLLIDKHANDKLWADNEDFNVLYQFLGYTRQADATHMECPLDLKEAISSLCFAAPRCADLPELIQVQMAFAGKYGKEFVAAATELMPECGVNRQLIEHLSVRAPSPEVKLNLLKEIAEEHGLDWDPTESETELLKPHEDLLNGPSILSSTQLPIPQEKHEEPVLTPPEQIHNEQSDSDTEFDILDFPEVPSSSVLPTHASETVSRPEMLPFPPSALSELNDEPENIVEKSEKNEIEHKQFLPFISPPSDTIAVKENIQSPQTETTVSDDLQTTTVKECSPFSRARTGIKDDFQDVLAAAKAAAENAERAAAAARAAASLAHVRINELVKKQNEYESNENPFSGDTYEPNTPEKPHLDHHDSVFSSSSPPQSLTSHQPQRLPSMDDGFMSYPNLFTSCSPSGSSPAQSFNDNGGRSGGEH